MKRSTFFLVIVCTVICVGYIYAANCYHFCRACGCSYSTPNKCLFCPAAAGSSSHYRKITHFWICDTCREQGHSADGIGYYNGMNHVKYSWPDNCHGEAEGN